MTILRVQRSPLGALYRSPLGVRGRIVTPDEIVFTDWVFWLSSMGDTGLTTQELNRMITFFDRLRNIILPEVRRDINVDPLSRVRVFFPFVNTAFQSQSYNTATTRWIRHLAAPFGRGFVTRRVNVILLYGGHSPHGAPGTLNYSCGAETPSLDVNQVSVPSLGTPPEEGEAEAWFSANFAEHYTRPTIGGVFLHPSMANDLASFQSRINNFEYNKTIVLFNIGPPSVLAPVPVFTDVWLIRANNSPSAPVVSIAYDPGVVQPKDIFAGRFSQTSCPDYRTDVSSFTISHVNQAVAMNPSPNPEHKWILSGESWEPQTLDAATLISLIQPHL